MFHLYEVLRAIKFIETKQTGVSRGGGGNYGESNYWVLGKEFPVDKKNTP